MTKRIAIALVMIALAIGVGGWSCAANKPVTAQLPAGAINQTDAQSYRVLNDVHAFLQSVRDSVAAGKLTLNESQKALFNHLAASSNAADVVWQAYHSGASNDAAGLAATTNKLNAELAAAQQQIVLAP